MRKRDLIEKALWLVEVPKKVGEMVVLFCKIKPSHREGVLSHVTTRHGQHVGRVQLLEHGLRLTRVNHEEQLVVSATTQCHWLAATANQNLAGH